MNVKNLLFPAVLLWLGAIAAWTFAGWGAVGFYILGGVIMSVGTLINQAHHYNKDPHAVEAMIRFLADKVKK